MIVVKYQIKRMFRLEILYSLKCQKAAFFDNLASQDKISTLPEFGVILFDRIPLWKFSHSIYPLTSLSEFG